MRFAPFRHVRCYEPDGQRFVDDYLDKHSALDAHRRTVAGGRAVLSRVVERSDLSIFKTSQEETVLADWVRGDG